MYMQNDNNRQAIHAPSVMTAEFFTPDGQRYNFEETVIEEGMTITLTNDTGHSTVLRFWNSRQSQRNFPLDRDAEAADQRKKRSRLFSS
jgi:hypothetical protein